MSTEKRSYDYGVDGTGETALEHLNDAIASYRQPYWEGREDHKDALRRLEAARDDILNRQEFANTNQRNVVAGPENSGEPQASTLTQEQSAARTPSPFITNAAAKLDEADAKAKPQLQQGSGRTGPQIGSDR